MKTCRDCSANEFADQYVSIASKEKRKGKIFIDYLRNGRGATSVAAYSTRANSQATISVPVAWDELNKDLKPNFFTIRNLLKRLNYLNDDPWKQFSKTKQSITKEMQKAFKI